MNSGSDVWVFTMCITTKNGCYKEKNTQTHTHTYGQIEERLLKIIAFLF